MRGGIRFRAVSVPSLSIFRGMPWAAHWPKNRVPRKTGAELKTFIVDPKKTKVDQGGKSQVAPAKLRWKENIRSGEEDAGVS
jgi:hypothetical protein